MITNRWERIIDAISYVKPECIDIEKIKRVLDYDREFDSQVLDNLYILGLLSLDEYKIRLSKYIDRLQEGVEFAQDKLKRAEDMGDKFDPMIFYCCTMGYRGAAVQDKENFDFMDNFNVEK